MKAMILAAGVGSRLDPLTRAIPKPMVPIVNRPVIEHIVLDLKKHGFDDIHVNLHYLGDVISDYLGDGSRLGVRLSYAHEEKLWGDAGSVKRSQDFFAGETFLVVGGDDISDMDLSGLMALHREKKATAVHRADRRGRPVAVRHRRHRRRRPHQPLSGKAQRRQRVLQHGQYGRLRL